MHGLALFFQQRHTTCSEMIASLSILTKLSACLEEISNGHLSGFLSEQIFQEIALNISRRIFLEPENSVEL